MGAALRNGKFAIPLLAFVAACGSASDDASKGTMGTAETSGSGSLGTGTGSGSEMGTGSFEGTSSSSAATSGGASVGTTSSGTGAGPGSADTAGGVAGPRGGGFADAGIPVAPGTLTAGAWDDNRNFDLFTAYRAKIVSQQTPGVLPFVDAAHEAVRDASLVAPTPRETLDISFVIDTTGSMGDEIRYLQGEFLAISKTVAMKYPNAAPRWSLVLYRDVGDQYVVRPFDFTADPTVFQSELAAQSAGGGGDFPEAPEQGLAAMEALAWRAEPNAAKVAFWVADAPHHDTNAVAFAATLDKIRTKGVHVYPVASSGIDEFTELTMRTVAQYTLGRYLFLTNDSGVGGDHKLPSIPCYFVTKLDNAILRMVDIELTGVYHEPVSSEVVRVGGNPQNGACVLGTGQTVTVF
ncbi:MAG TPA: vWA domain-containing protein [Polyangiaceae bacterium]|nr:vWA domain-containing protein [Polyangiaceae bacterium]